MNIIYGFWAQIAGWPMILRAALTVAIAFFAGFIVLLIFYPRIFCIALKLLDILWKGEYLILTGFLRLGCSGDKYFQGAEKFNRISEIGETFSVKLCKLQEKLSRCRKVSFWRLLIIYGVVILLIGLPDMLRDKVSDEYLHYFSGVSNWYRNWEGHQLEAAKGHAPLFKKSQATIAKTTESIKQEEVTEAEAESQIILTLSEKGWSGANIRKDATSKSTAITSVSGDIQLIYIEQKNGWSYVVLPDGIEGWIRNNLVEGVPEE